MSFPADIIMCMKDCILSILWAKDDIYNFFKNNNCNSSDLKVIANYKDRENGLSRSNMIDSMFNTLSQRNDEGLGQFRAMLHSLVQWSHFDSYYFDKLKKLDRTTAENNLTRLRQLQEIRDAKIRDDRKQREQKDISVQKPSLDVRQLLGIFHNLCQNKMSPKERGYELEKIILELAKNSNMEISKPFRVNGEQIDGAVKYDGEHYLIEAKWQDKASSNEAVYQFVGKIEGKMYGRGIFISIHGFSEYVVKSVVHGKALKTIFIDGEDMVLVLEEHLTFEQMIDRKVKAAQTKGEIYINPITEKNKL